MAALPHPHPVTNPSIEEFTQAQTDRDALIALYNATDGPNWRENGGWNTGADLSQWYGVELDGQGRVVRLRLRFNNLQGHIPPQLGNLGALKHLSLSINKLVGCIPAELGKLNVLVTLDLNNNELTGPIPPEFGNLAALQYLNIRNNQLSGHIPPQLGDLGALKHLYLAENKLDGSIPPELGKLAALTVVELWKNQLTGSVPKELMNLRKMARLRLHSNPLEGPLPPTQYGIAMRKWFEIPTEDEKLRVRAAGEKDSGAKQPLIVRGLDSITDAWHVVVPVVDDVTDVLLLTATADVASPFWWICVISLVVADIERLWLLFTLCLTIAMLPLLWCIDLLRGDFVGRTGGRLFAGLNCRGDAPQNTFRDRLKDSFLWVPVGSRSRCSPLWRLVGMSLDAKVQEADRAGIGFGAIDKWVARHPFSFLGQFLFGKDFALKGGDDGVTRRARVMIRAVGETLVVDSLFLALSVVSGGWDGDLTGVAAISALFSVLELLTELQYYVAEAGAVLEPVSSYDATAAVPADVEQGVVSDPSTTDNAANV